MAHLGIDTQQHKIIIKRQYKHTLSSLSFMWKNVFPMKNNKTKNNSKKRNEEEKKLGDICNWSHAKITYL